MTARPTPRRLAARAVPAVLAATLAAAAVSGLGGCGVPGEDTAHVIPDDALPFGLAASTTSTTTLAGETGLLPTGAEVVVYFSSERGFVEMTRALTRSFSLSAVVDVIASERTEPDTGFRSAVRPEDVRSVEVRAGVATVELDKRFLDLPTAEQGLAIAQLVLTLTSQPGVGQISFVIDDKPAQVPRADGTIAEEPVSRDDFVALLAPA